jgi:hypothetical protein
MALKICKECGNEVSDKSKKCVKCGAPVKRSLSPIEWAGIGLVVFFMFMSAMNSDKPKTRPAAQNIKTEKTATATAKRVTYSNWYTTKPMHIAALSEAILDRAISFRNQGDATAFEKYVTDGYPNIFILKGGDEVYLEDLKAWKGYAKVRPRGGTTSLWVQYKALEQKE